MRIAIVATVSIAFTLSVAAAPTAALAERFHGGVGAHAMISGRPVPSHPFVSRPSIQRPFFPRPFVHRPFVHRPFFQPFVPFGAVVVYAPPPVSYGPPAYYDSPAYYDQPMVYGSGGGTVSVAPPPPLPPPTPTVVEYPTGRYELRGDGLTVPYTWVWIPNSPPPPPPAAPPAGAPPSGDPPQPRHSQLYRWTDEDGVAHWTDRSDAVPEEYRTEAKQGQPL